MGVFTLSRSRDKAKPTYWDSLKELIESAKGEKPTKVNGQQTARTEYYKWVLLNKLKGLFEIECPEEWDKDYILDNLLLRGKFCITDTTAGVMPLECGTHGNNVFHRPTNLLIANHVLGNFERKIDVDAVLVYLFDDRVFMSYEPTIRIYAEKLASCDAAIEVNLINSKVAFVFECVDSKQAAEAKLIYDKISSGEPAVFARTSTGMNMTDKMQFFSNDVVRNYICDKVQAEKRDIYNEFLTQVGINNAAQEKRERLLVDEVNSNNDELMINMAYAYENIKRAVEKANKMFPEINLSIKLPYIDKLKESSTVEQQKKGDDKNDEPSESNGDLGNKK